MGTSHYLRFPHLSGDLVTFVAENDIWVAPVSGGRAWRISAMQLPARNPRFSPDGTVIAWTVVQAGAPEVVAANTDGGDYRRLTYWGHQSTRVKGFTAQGEVLATSSYRHEDPRLSWAYAVPLDGSAQTVLPYGPVDTVVHGEALGDERPVLIGSVMTREQAWWKRYRGGTAGKLWMDADGGGNFERFLPELDGNLTDPMWVGGRVAFLSDHEGYGNLYSVDPQGTDLRRHTDNEDFYVRHASTDGARIVYESAGELWLLDSLGPQSVPVRLDIRLGSAATARRPLMLNASRHLSGAVPATGGDASVVETHGTLHWLTHKDGPSRILEATPGVRARLGRPLGADSVVYVADHGGEEALFIRKAFAGAQQPHTQGAEAAAPAGQHVPDAGLWSSEQAADTGSIVLPAPVPASGAGVPVPEAAAGNDDRPDASRSGDPGATVLEAQDTADGAAMRSFAFDGPFRASGLAVSPDGRSVAVPGELGGLLLLDVAAGAFFPLAASRHGAIDHVGFSADSQWITWAEPVAAEGSRTRIRLARAEKDAEIHDLTDGRFRDTAPAFTPDGRFLAFLSDRSFDPVYDTHRFDLSFPASTKPFLVALAADTPSPFGPAVHPAGGNGSGGRDAGTRDSDAPAEVVVDPDRIAERIIAVPVAQGSYESLAAVEGALLWTAGEPGGVTGDGRATPTEQEPARRLERFDLDRRAVDVLVPEADSYSVSGNGSTAVVIRQGRITAVPTSGKVDQDSPERVEVDLDRIRVVLNPGSVWSQAYQEAWRLQRDFFWTEDLGGLDWNAVGAKYLPLIERIGSHDDLVDVLWELHGELGTSHAYVTPALNAEPGGAQGFLGAELETSGRGWVVRRIFAGESSDPQASSPLSAPGVAVAPGDIIEAVDGIPVPPAYGPSVLLTGSAGRTVELTVARPADGGAPAVRRVAVVPLRSEERLRYQNWVSANRAVVHQVSEGRFGYLHIPDMVANGWAQLHRDLDRETARDALIVDVRRNRGGHTSQLVAELIGRKVTAWAFPRGEEPGTYPAHAPRGPVVILADEFAGSDGDIITQVAKLRGIGPVVGTRTWGGVIGIDGRFRLADGTGVSQPRYSFWMTGGVGWGVENRGVEPDIEVPFPPHAYAAGEDPQLERGVATLREMLAELPTDVAPARVGYRSLRPAPLPPRPGR